MVRLLAYLPATHSSRYKGIMCLHIVCEWCAIYEHLISDPIDLLRVGSLAEVLVLCYDYMIWESGD
jgi:hypothetical protein